MRRAVDLSLTQRVVDHGRVYVNAHGLLCVRWHRVSGRRVAGDGRRDGRVRRFGQRGSHEDFRFD